MTGTLGLLDHAARRGLIDLAAAFAALHFIAISRRDRAARKPQGGWFEERALFPEGVEVGMQFRF